MRVEALGDVIGVGTIEWVMNVEMRCTHFL